MVAQLNLSSPESWLIVGPWIVGATFLWTGAVKAIAPHVFSAHLTRLAWIPPKLNEYAVVAAAGLESAWGAALILGVVPAFLLPATVAVLAILTATSWWGVRSGKTTDCGCYGGFMEPSIAQSVAINALLAALVIAAWLVVPYPSNTPAWKLAVTALAGIAAAALATASQRFVARKGRYMIETSPLKVGRRWRSRWGAFPNGDRNELLVSYLGPDCPHCKNWVRVLNAMQQAPDLPRVAGVVATTHEALEKFVETSGIRFPITTISQTLMNRLVWGVPTTVLVSAGRIQQQWSGSMPPDFYDRFRNAFFPNDAPSSENGDSEEAATTAAKV